MANIVYIPLEAEKYIQVAYIRARSAFRTPPPGYSASFFNCAGEGFPFGEEGGELGAASVEER